MRLHRFIGDFDLREKEVQIKNIDHIKQIKGVLRLEIGDYLILCDGRGNQAKFSILEMNKDKILCAFEESLPNNDPDKKVSLYLAILKKENFELAVQKAVECGIANIIPVITERTVKTGLNFERLEKIIREATEQCERSTVPVLQKTINFENALAHGYASEEKIIFDGNGPMYEGNKNKKSASIFIGPEGGWTEEELNLARTAGYKINSLGALTLRGETAAIVATYRTVNEI